MFPIYVWHEHVICHNYQMRLDGSLTYGNRVSNRQRDALAGPGQSEGLILWRDTGAALYSSLMARDTPHVPRSYDAYIYLYSAGELWSFGALALWSLGLLGVRDSCQTGTTREFCSRHYCDSELIGRRGMSTSLVAHVDWWLSPGELWRFKAFDIECESTYSGTWDHPHTVHECLLLRIVFIVTALEPWLSKTTRGISGLFSAKLTATTLLAYPTNNTDGSNGSGFGGSGPASSALFGPLPSIIIFFMTSFVLGARYMRSKRRFQHGLGVHSVLSSIATNSIP
ncbi:predicted protein [Histoplasma capsulatum H143]|uniref:Uncharacterized protein n=1 Tax=Ajellomyces capsulatus (strain H143) TaxID=544712 RepID=C6H3K3_AJECH|nr:predicted protein [Histoplasma capsulatum H143]